MFKNTYFEEYLPAAASQNAKYTASILLGIMSLNISWSEVWCFILSRVYTFKSEKLVSIWQFDGLNLVLNSLLALLFDY